MKVTILFNRIFEGSCGDDYKYIILLESRENCFYDHDKGYMTISDILSIFKSVFSYRPSDISEKEFIINFFKRYNIDSTFINFEEVVVYN